MIWSYSLFGELNYLFSEENYLSCNFFPDLKWVTWSVSTTRLLLSSLPFPSSLSHTFTHKPEITSHCKSTKSKGEARRSNWSNIPNSKLAFSPKRATAELRHSSSIGNRATPSPSASAVASSPFSSDYDSATSAADDDNGRDRHPRDRSIRSYFQSFFPHFLFPNDDLHRAHPHRSKISTVILVAIVFAAVISVSSLVQRLVCAEMPSSWVACLFLCECDWLENSESLCIVV